MGMIIALLCLLFFSILLYSPLNFSFSTHYLMLQLPSVAYFDNILHLKIWWKISTLVFLVLITQVFLLNISKILGKLLNCVSGLLSKPKICLIMTINI